MKLRYSLFFILFFLILLPNIDAEESREEDVIQIVTYKEDITGDGHADSITLEGVLLSDTSSYYQFVWATITSTSGDVWEADLPGGSNPSLHFADITDDGALDFLYRSTLDHNNDTHTHALYTIEEKTITPIPLPKETFVHGSFQDNFLIHLFITPHQEPVIIDLIEYANEYVDAGVYDENGQLYEQRDVIVEPIQHVWPYTDDQLHKHGLLTTQKVHAAPYTNHLGNIKSTWIYENEAWKLLESTWE